MFGYVSTRGKAPRLTFEGATLGGLAADGGLYVPEAFPRLSAEDVAGLSGQSYVETAWRVMLPFVADDLPSAELLKILQASYRDFRAPLQRLDDGFYVMELFHGPTLAFKDVALQFLGHVFDYFLKKRGRRATIIGATSGDTGSAAISAFRGKDAADIFILHPRNRVSEVQRRQMTAVPDANVHNLAIEGSFDDCQDIVKALFADADFRARTNLSAVNSINWARILAQAVYYVHAAARLRAQTGKDVSFCVPTGNFGNVYAGYVARLMGAPVDRLVAATNRNDIIHRFFATGRMKAEGVSPSLSPSMDIQMASNFERLLFELFGRQGAAVDTTMRHFHGGGPFHLEEPVMRSLRGVFASGRQDDAQTAETMRRFYAERNYLCDPHTAVGLGVAEAYRKENPGGVLVALATAHPAKFPDAVRAATGVTPELPSHLAGLMTQPERCDVLPPEAGRVRDFILAKGAAS